MNWSSLKPASWNPADAWRSLFSADAPLATQGLRDCVIFLTLGIALVFALRVLWQTIASWFRIRPYLSLSQGGDLPQ